MKTVAVHTQPYVISNLVNEGRINPAQWEGTCGERQMRTTIRYRWGVLSIMLHRGEHPTSIYETRLKRIPIDAPMSDEELRAYLPPTIQLRFAHEENSQ